jgi:hypothetical protein
VAPLQDALHDGAREGPQVDAAVLEELRVLGRDEGVHDQARHALARHHGAPFFEQLADELPVLR